MKTGVNAAKLAIAAFIVPYIFVLAPELLMINATAVTVLLSMITAILGMWGNILQRIVFFLGGLCLIVPGATTDIAGVAVLVLAFLWQKRNKGGALTATGEDD